MRFCKRAQRKTWLRKTWEIWQSYHVPGRISFYYCDDLEVLGQFMSFHPISCVLLNHTRTWAITCSLSLLGQTIDCAVVNATDWRGLMGCSLCRITLVSKTSGICRCLVCSWLSESLDLPKPVDLLARVRSTTKVPISVSGESKDNLLFRLTSSRIYINLLPILADILPQGERTDK